MYKHIPNTVTLLASFFGVLATALAFQGALTEAAYCILLAAFFDFTDGFLARALNAKSPLGADLDSLADVVSFGVAPAAISYQLLFVMLPSNLKIFAYFAFIIVPFSALRLAIFNNATNQSTSFIGLPVPAHAMIWVGLVFLKDTSFEWTHVFYHPLALFAYTIIFSFFLVSKLPLFTLKFSKNNPIYKHTSVTLFLLLSIVLLGFFSLGGLFFIILLYICTGIFNYFQRQCS